MNETTPPRRTAALELALIYGAFILINVVFGQWQKQISLQDGKGWEGVGYYTVAWDFADGQPLAAEGPYVYRLLTPWLVAKIAPEDLFRGFRIVNIAANAAGVLLLWLWFRRHIGSWKIRVLLVLLYLIEWDAPTRWIHFYPVHVDPILFVTLFAGLLLVERERAKPDAVGLAGMCALMVVGVLNREVALLPALAWLFAENPIRRTDSLAAALKSLQFPSLRRWLPFVLGFATFIAIKRSVQQIDEYSFASTVVGFLYDKPLITYAHAWLLAFGPVIFILLFNWRRAAALLLARQDWLIYFAACAVLGYIGGTDTERLLYWSMPVTFVLLGKAIEDRAAELASIALTSVFVAGQVLSSRILWTTPDYPHEYPHSFPILQQFGSNVPFMDLFSYHGYRMKTALSLVQFVVFGIVVLVWMRRRRTVKGES